MVMASENISTSVRQSLHHETPSGSSGSECGTKNTTVSQATVQVAITTVSTCWSGGGGGGRARSRGVHIHTVPKSCDPSLDGSQQVLV